MELINEQTLARLSKLLPVRRVTALPASHWRDKQTSIPTDNIVFKIPQFDTFVAETLRDA